jgi:hypothetical protein
MRSLLANKSGSYRLPDMISNVGSSKKRRQSGDAKPPKQDKESSKKARRSKPLTAEERDEQASLEASLFGGLPGLESRASHSKGKGVARFADGQDDEEEGAAIGPAGRSVPLVDRKQLLEQDEMAEMENGQVRLPDLRPMSLRIFTEQAINPTAFRDRRGGRRCRRRR